MKYSTSLKLNHIFQRLYRSNGQANGYFVFYARKNRLDTNRVGITVSKKLGKAHIRNRVRRRIREVYRLNEEKFQPGWDIVVVARSKLNLESVNIPHYLIDIGDWAFHCCWKLKSITIPDGTTKIGNNAFYECRELESVTIGNSVKEIGECAFYYCYNLKRLIIPDSVTKIGAAAFRLCQTLTDIELSNNLTIIEQCLLCECYSITKITIPEGVTSIGASVFSDCKSLKEVFCKPTTPPKGSWDMFSNNATDRKIYVPASDDDSIINAYKAKEYWSNYANYIFEEE